MLDGLGDIVSSATPAMQTAGVFIAYFVNLFKRIVEFFSFYSGITSFT